MGMTEGGSLTLTIVNDSVLLRFQRKLSNSFLNILLHLSQDPWGNKSSTHIYILKFENKSSHLLGMDAAILNSKSAHRYQPVGTLLTTWQRLFTPLVQCPWPLLGCELQSQGSRFVFC